ncbi:hypothetical protein AGOR_G00188890 [Albula goreensis]|uniref:C-type lectin domain-containing protein n=1 Tax=Albula goreensis TaxID=1534307 RepID=A0A8T3CUN5_9TELE|nr:hypothetical protein AGOR_G00188890 [Albula goreensis]
MEMSDVIYANVERVRNIKSRTTPDQNPPNSPGEQHTGRRTYRLTAVCLGILTVLQLNIITALCFYSQRDQLQSDYRSVIAEKGLGHLCPPGWIKFSSSCYYVSRERKTWSDSRQYCRDRDADLVIINDKEERMYFTVFRILWIGLTDSNEEGTWKWVDGTTLITGYWRSGEPNNVGSGEDCAVMHPEGWNDLPCTNKAYWVCEKPAP